MKVLLLAHIKNIGKKGEVVEIKEGYARNFLIPQKKAVPAQVGLVKAHHDKIHHEHAQRQAYEEKLTNTLKNISGISLVYELPASPVGHLYASLGAQAVLERLMVEKKVTQTVMRDILKILESSQVFPIKTCGSHMIPLDYHGSTGNLTLVVNGA
jgi:large subunit ribosomal protein L9